MIQPLNGPPLAHQPHGDINRRRYRTAGDRHPNRLPQLAHINLETGSNILDDAGYGFLAPI